MSDIFPSDKGYRMPPEWHQHSSTLLLWPENNETWPGDRLARVEKVYIQILRILSRYEKIHLIVSESNSQKHVLDIFQREKLNSDHIVLHVKKINDVWARDCGPVMIGRGRKNNDWEYAITNWEYNAWGGKYPPYQDDNQIPSFLADKYKIPKFNTGFVLEGGSIEVNGNGTLLTTESVLLNKNRNPSFSKSQIEEILKNYLGQKEIIWLKKGLAGDDTDGHIDDLCRFLNNDTIVTVATQNEKDVNYTILQENLEILKSAKNIKGRSFNIEILPLPETKINGTTVDGSAYVPASYANFYIANGVVLMPFYDDRYDRQAQELLQHYFPSREVIGIPCNDLVWGQGSIHCITQQLYGL